MHTSASIILLALCARSALGSGHYLGPLTRPTVLKSGYLADTHEVAAARGAHLAALAEESHRYGHEDDYGSHGYGGDYSHSFGLGGGYSGSYGQGVKYHGPTAVPQVLKNGHVADTHDVAIAKAAHYAAVSEAKANAGYGYDADHGYGNYGYSSYGYGQGSHSGVYDRSYAGAYDYSYGHDLKYHGPTAIPHVLKNGHIADTQEVSAAKAHHYAAVSETKSRHGYSGYGYGHGDSDGYSGHY